MPYLLAWVLTFLSNKQGLFESGGAERPFLLLNNSPHFSTLQWLTGYVWNVFIMFSVKKCHLGIEVWENYPLILHVIVCNKDAKLLENIIHICKIWITQQKSQKPIGHWVWILHISFCQVMCQPNIWLWIILFLEVVLVKSVNSFSLFA